MDTYLIRATRDLPTNKGTIDVPSFVYEPQITGLAISLFAGIRKMMYAAIFYIPKFLWLATCWNINRSQPLQYLNPFDPLPFNLLKEFSNPNESCLCTASGWLTCTPKWITQLALMSHKLNLAWAITTPHQFLFWEYYVKFQFIAFNTPIYSKCSLEELHLIQDLDFAALWDVFLQVSPSVLPLYYLPTLSS